ncbi:fasciclin domain-containing protein [Salsipaludibacter albus]|uniref:fasciclin domain-containing protein n=1 Tax=Salsipaludibacter albus TaxID=2849650 RepID=UPI001EE46906|nr:fasciclin domain-containing protein [Salsipaludibacter albus]MBY5164017.1 fasciclin domain-containing protein [Salsipaludibacter albus]
MRKMITLAAAAALTLSLAGTASAEKPGFAGPGLDTTTVETAVALSGTPFDFDDDAGDFDILVAAVVATGADAILDGSSDYTVFAPTDQAFLDAVSAVAGVDITDEEEAFNTAVAAFGVDGVTDILLYHVTEGWRPSPSLLNGKGDRVVEMANGGTISVSSAGMIDGNNSDATIVAPDIKTADGGIHVIDFVLLP